MTDQERRHVTDLLAEHEALIHWCETLIAAHADLVELASDADLLNLVETPAAGGVKDAGAEGGGAGGEAGPGFIT